jgi:queuine tRNA-ribosyltransferase
MFKIIAKDKKTKARVGILKTKKGEIETPFFMPVATKASVRFISTEDLEEMKAHAVISNALILHLRPGDKIIKKFGGIGKWMNYSGINVTDSGGFQMYSKAIFLKSENKGVHFRNPISGEKLFITPEKDMKIQFNINSDIAMCLDSMPLYSHSKEEIAESVRKTTLWASRCKKEHDKLQRKNPRGKKQLLFGITQGGVYPDLRKKSAKELARLDFDGYSVGGLGIGEPREKQYEMVEIQKSIIPENKPIYLMGIGAPIEIVEAISRGVDMFDSRFPTQNARRGTLFTSEGRLRLLNLEHKESKKPIDKNCKCFVCRNYTRAFMRHQLIEETGTGKRLATFHNLYYLQNLVEEARAAVKSGKFLDFKNKIEKIYEEN